MASSSSQLSDLISVQLDSDQFLNWLKQSEFSGLASDDRFYLAFNAIASIKIPEITAGIRESIAQQIISTLRSVRTNPTLSSIRPVSPIRTPYIAQSQVKGDTPFVPISLTGISQDNYLKGLTEESSRSPSGRRRPLVSKAMSLNEYREKVSDEESAIYRNEIDKYNTSYTTYPYLTASTFLTGQQDFIDFFRPIFKWTEYNARDNQTLIEIIAYFIKIYRIIEEKGYTLISPFTDEMRSEQEAYVYFIGLISEAKTEKVAEMTVNALQQIFHKNNYEKFNQFIHQYFDVVIRSAIVPYEVASLYILKTYGASILTPEEAQQIKKKIQLYNASGTGKTYFKPYPSEYLSLLG